jgi:hypothetical protein
MTDLWDSEAAEYLDDEGAEWYEDGEDVDFGDDDVFGEAKSDLQRKREAAKRRAADRRRKLLIERRTRAARSRTPARPMTTTAAIKNTRTALQREHLTNQVRADSLGGAVGGVRRRTKALENTVSAAAVTNTIKNELDKFTEREGNVDGVLPADVTNLLKTIVDFVPLAFVRSDVKGYRNPTVVAAAAAGAVAITGLIIRGVRKPAGEIGGGGSVPRTGRTPSS